MVSSCFLYVFLPPGAITRFSFVGYAFLRFTMIYFTACRQYVAFCVCFFLNTLSLIPAYNRFPLNFILI